MTFEVSSMKMQSQQDHFMQLSSKREMHTDIEYIGVLSLAHYIEGKIDWIHLK
jgi:hypothetical protein